MTRLLLLGGTGEGRALAARLQDHLGLDVISSLAGRVPDPALPVGEVRIGGFGGVEGLRDWLRAERIDAVVDATHPFAATITDHAKKACDDLGIAHLLVARPAWDSTGAIVVKSDSEAAEVVDQQGYSRIFLTTGRTGTAVFARSTAWFLIRVVTEPDPGDLPVNRCVLLSRGPYHYDDETALLAEYRIDALVTKNSGGAMTRAKIDAAADCGVPVIMIARPALPPDVVSVATVAEAAEWVTGR